MRDLKWIRGRAGALGLAFIAAIAVVLAIGSSRRIHADNGAANVLRTMGNADGPNSPDVDKVGGGPAGKSYGKGGPGGGGAPANPPPKTVDPKTSADPTGRQ